MNKLKHTPGELTYMVVEASSRYPHATIAAGQGFHSTKDGQGFGIDGIMSEADAQHMVKAWNNYYSLLEIAKMAVEYADGPLVERAIAAIAKTKENPDE